MTQALIIAAAKTVDDSGSLKHCLDLEASLHQQGARLTELVICRENQNTIGKNSSRC